MAYGDSDVIAVSFGNMLQFLDGSTGHVLETVEDAHDSTITALAWAHGQHEAAAQTVRILATASRDKRVRLWRSPQR